MSERENRKRGRRTNNQLKSEMFDALARMVEKQGFNKIPLTAFVKEANIDPNIFYRHYGTMDRLYEEFVDQYTFWANDIITISDIGKLGYRRFYAEIFKRLYLELKNNRVMQRLFIWELSENNFTTRKTTRTREKAHQNWVAYYKDIFKKSGMDIENITALILAGVYYISLNNNTLCSINLSEPYDQSRILKAIDTFVDLIFDKLEERQRWQKIIDRMRDDGVSQTKIVEYLGISGIQLKRLTKTK